MVFCKFVKSVIGGVALSGLVVFCDFARSNKIQHDDIKSKVDLSNKTNHIRNRPPDVFPINKEVQKSTQDVLQDYDKIRILFE